MKKSYTIRRAVHPDHDAIVFEFDRDSRQELFRDFSQLKNLGAHAGGIVGCQAWRGIVGCGHSVAA